MHSTGGVATIDEAAAHAALRARVGTGRRVVGAARVAELAGIENAISFDMGGTSTDVCLISGGRAERTPSARVGGLPIRLPMVDIHTVGAGGGSIVWLDAGGACGSARRARAPIPGPACYGRGGDAADGDGREPVLGRLAGAARGRRRARPRRGGAGRCEGFDPADVVAVVNAEMLRALRVVSVEHGHDPRDFALVAFGGAGPLHACALADELGISTVLVPAAAGVLSALGLVASEERRDHVRSYVCPLAEAGELPDDGEADLRYRGQSFELTVPLGERAGRALPPGATRSATATRIADRTIELVARADPDVRPGPTLDLPPAEPLEVPGPALLELDGATCWIAPGWVGVRDGQPTARTSSTLRITRV